MQHADLDRVLSLRGRERARQQQCAGQGQRRNGFPCSHPRPPLFWIVAASVFPASRRRKIRASGGLLGNLARGDLSTRSFELGIPEGIGRERRGRRSVGCSAAYLLLSN